MSDRCNQAKSIFLAAIEEHTPEQWPGFLDQACAGDVRLRCEVEKLLRARSEMGTFHEPPRPAALATARAPEIGERPGTIIGPYKLLEQIGEGGFGLVFMAEQQQPVRRKVALKILKPGMDTRQVIARFEAERQALALMDHPNIARVLDAGETSSGRPHFVMELVKGVPITDYCDQNRLSTRERLALFTHVCHAVQHAHHKGIIHRDLKPSNVMVTLHDGVPVVKVIDFGIAKALGQQLTEKTLFTGFAQMVGTPLYMSPEQAQLNGLDIDTRSDIYSLGVLLYELLAGVTPFDRERLRTAGYDEMRRIIREEDPPSPSTRLSSLGQTAVTVSAQRQSDPKRLSRLLRGELDWIVMKALDKDRTRRYETANELARDVDRYLRDEPVAACPPSTWYRFYKFARRKKSALVVAAAVFLALAGITGGIGWGLRDRAGREEALDQAVDRTLKEAGPLVEQEKWHEALGAVERADQLLAAAGRTERPPRLLELRTELSMAQRLERIDRHRKPELPVLTSSEGGARPSFQEHAGSSEQDFFMGRQADAEYALAFRDFGIDLDALEPAEAAEQIARRSIFPALVKALDQWGVFRRRARGQDDPGWKKLVTIAGLADPDPLRNRCREILLSRDRTAMEGLADSVPIEQVPVRTLVVLGMALSYVGAPEKAISLLRRAQHQYPSDLWLNDALGDLSWGAFRPPHTEDALRFYSIALALRPTRPQLHYVVGLILHYKIDVEGAIREFEAALKLDPKLTIAHISLGDALRTKNVLDPAIAEFRKAIELDPKSAPAHNSLGWALKAKNQLDEAIAEFRKAIEIDPARPNAHNDLGIALKAKNQWDLAETEFRTAIELDPKLAPVHVNLGIALAAKNQWDEAIAEHKKAIDLDPKLEPAHDNLGVALRAKNKLDEAIAEFRKAIELDPKCGSAHMNLGVALRDKNQLDLAVTEFRKAIELDPGLAMAHYNLGGALKAKNQWDEAIAECRKCIELDPKFVSAHYSLGNALRARNQWEDAIAEYRKVIELDPGLANAHYDLGNALVVKNQWDEAIAVFHKAIDIDPKRADAHNDLGSALKAKNQLEPAMTEYRKAIDLDPKLASAHFNLGNALRAKNQLDEAIAEYKKAIALDPKYARTHFNLGSALKAKNQLEEAIGEYKKAIELDPKYALAHNNLGDALKAKNQLDPAVAEFRTAIELDPKLALAHNNLADALNDKHQWDEAIAEYRTAIELGPKLTLAHFNLGIALMGKNQLDAAVAEFKKTIELDPKGAGAHHNLGVALQAKNQWDEAISEYKKATEFDPKGAGAHYDLGNALRARSRWEDAIAEFRTVIDLQVDYYAEANCNLAGILQSQGQLSAALNFYKQGHASGSKRKDWRYPSAQWVANAERLVHFEAKLADVLRGKATAGDNRERLGLAEVCRLKRRHVAAAGLFADAFTAEAKLAYDLKAGHRYSAACCAVMAAAGPGTDVDKLDEQEHRRLRQQALAWLRADLEQRTGRPEAGKPAGRQVVQTTLAHWLRDTDLASVRDPDALQKLTAQEQEAWRKLWADVAELLKKAGDAKS